MERGLTQACPVGITRPRTPSRERASARPPARGRDGQGAQVADKARTLFLRPRSLQPNINWQDRRTKCVTTGSHSP